MNKRLVVMGLLMALTATGAIADTQHYATAPTKKEAKRLATAEARATARDSASCYHPARQVRECAAVEGGFRCRAETSHHYSTCRRAGWVNEFTPSTYAKYYNPWPSSQYQYDSTPNAFWSSPYLAPSPINSTQLRMTQYLPPPPTPFPN